MLFGEIPDPFGSVADNHLGLGAAPPAFPGLDVDSLTELLGRLDGAGVGRRIGIADRKAFLVPEVWVKAQPSLASRVCAGRPSSLPLRSAVSFFTTGTPVLSNLHIEDGDGFSHDDRQIVRSLAARLVRYRRRWLPPRVPPIWS